MSKSPRKTTYASTKRISAPGAHSGDDEILLTPTGVATMLGMNRATLDSLDPQPPYFYLGKRKYIAPAALRTWLDDRQKAALAA